MSTIPFRKYHGLGNDFIVLDGMAVDLPLDFLTNPHNAALMCHRHTGIGADGLLLMLKPTQPEAHAKMRIINADGSEPEMCGNGIRCIAIALHDHVPQFAKHSSIIIETLAGLKQCDFVFPPEPQHPHVRVDMGIPILDRTALSMQGNGPFVEELVEIAGRKLKWTAVSMGNPHVVTFLEIADDLRHIAEEVGPLMEVHPLFPNRTNVEFVHMTKSGAEVWVWERGCGITQACGTGACAVAVAAKVTNRWKASLPIKVQLPGGTLAIEVASDLRRVWMEGPAVEVFQGEYFL